MLVRAVVGAELHPLLLGQTLFIVLLTQTGNQRRLALVRVRLHALLLFRRSSALPGGRLPLHHSGTESFVLLCHSRSLLL